jgi:hypothetical protein
MHPSACVIWVKLYPVVVFGPQQQQGINQRICTVPCIEEILTFIHQRQRLPHQYMTSSSHLHSGAASEHSVAGVAELFHGGPLSRVT